MKRMIKGLAAAMLLAVLLAALAVFGSRALVLHAPVQMYYQEQLDRTDAPYACIVVPGAGIIGSDPGIYLKDRLDTALTLYQNGAAEQILLSGARGRDQLCHEADVMRRYLANHGVPESAMILDERGVDTAQTILHARAAAEGGKVIICTQELYAPRTVYLAQRFGLKADVAGSDVHIYTDGVGFARLRELLAAVKAVFEGVFVPEDCSSPAISDDRGAEND